MNQANTIPLRTSTRKTIAFFIIFITFYMLNSSMANTSITKPGEIFLYSLNKYFSFIWLILMALITYFQSFFEETAALFVFKFLYYLFLYSAPILFLLALNIDDILFKFNLPNNGHLGWSAIATIPFSLFFIFTTSVLDRLINVKIRYRISLLIGIGILGSLLTMILVLFF